jgi:DUF2075 family protein
MISRVLYQESQHQFIKDVERNIVFQKMQYAAEQCGIHSAENEIASWTNNAPHISTLLLAAGVTDSYVTFEFLVPTSRQRIDCMIYGKGENGEENAIHIELKQWSNKTVQVAESDGNFSTDDAVFNVEAFTGRANRIVAHPSQQVKGYQGYLSNFIEVVSKQEITLTGLAYCYNYLKKDSSKPTLLYADMYENLLKEFPTYSGDQKDELADRLGKLLRKGEGLSVFNKMMSSPIKPSKKLLNEVSNMIMGGDTSAFSLIEDQIVARNIILDKVRRLLKASKSNQKYDKNVIIVNGGPGTGKTVIALHILAELAKMSNGDSGLNILYATKSKPLLEGVKSKLRGNAKFLIKNVTGFLPAATPENAIDVLLVDEAHRIQKNANSQYTKTHLRTDLPQIDTIIRASKTTIFFIDDRQAIRGVEIGSSNLIREAAERWNAHVEECTLTSQFRCNGSDNYLNWIEQVLYNKPIESTFSESDFDFRIFDDPQELYDNLVTQNNVDGQTARLMAGFCWTWSQDIDEDGDLVKDVKIGDFAIPWETHEKIVAANRLPQGYVKWYEWAYKPEGIKQCGCIYTAQGFEFDYAGVIIGEDLKFDTETNQIITDKNNCKDPVLRRNVAEANMTFDHYVRNIYRVLMTRGMKGCFVYICDLNLRNYFKSLIKKINKENVRRF